MASVKRWKDLIKIDQNLYYLRGGINRVQNKKSEMEESGSWVSRKQNDRRRVKSRNHVQKPARGEVMADASIHQKRRRFKISIAHGQRG